MIAPSATAMKETEMAGEHRLTRIATVVISAAPGGRVRVKGNFSKVPFKVMDYSRQRSPKWIDAEPVLMLRRKRR